MTVVKNLKIQKNMDCSSVADTMANLRDFVLDGQDEVGDFQTSVLIILPRIRFWMEKGQSQIHRQVAVFSVAAVNKLECDLLAIVC